MHLQFDILSDLTNYTSREFYNKYKNELSLYYVFLYLYDNADEPLDDRVYYNEICDFYKDKHSIKYITNIYDISMFNRRTVKICKNTVEKNKCDRNCHLCLGARPLLGLSW